MATWRVMTTDLKDRGPDGKDETVGTKAEADALKTLRKKADTKVSVHLCSHTAGEPPSAWWNCKDDPRAQYEEL